MKLFIATLSTETNTFSPMPTGISCYQEYFVRHGTATQDAPMLMTEALHVWRDRAEALGWDVVESLAANAEPAGLTTAACYTAFKAEILDDLAAAGGAEIILLQLHGAMVAEGVDDCEGDLCSAIREAWPDALIGVSLDLHCHLTQALLNVCDLIIMFKEYPHDDATPRAEELFELARRTYTGEIKPIIRMAECHMVELYLTKSGAMQRFVDDMQDLEQQPGILSVSLAHGFPWGDVVDMDARTLVIADGDAEMAQAEADRLAQEFFAIRNDVACKTVGLEKALDSALAADGGPVVLADMGDNSGGGAPGDSTFMLQALIARGVRNAATGIYWDPMVVRACSDAGEGAKLTLRLGGKTCQDSGEPVDLTAQVMAIKSGLGQHLGKGLEPLGTMVWLRTGGELDILVNDFRTQVYHPEAFEQMGINLANKSLVTVKSLFHFYAPFAEIAKEIIQVATPGGTCPEFAEIPYEKRDLHYWPRVDDPFAIKY